MFSVAGAVVPGLVTEFGGEFIDTGHEDMHRLVQSLGLQLIDLEAGPEARLRPTFYFDGRRISESEVVRNFQPLARRVRQDQDAVGDVVTYRRHNPRARELDRVSISEYLERIGASGWVKELLEVAYVAEYGLDAGEQSALNLVLLIGTDPGRAFEAYGDSDERYSVRGGNQQVCDRLGAPSRSWATARTANLSCGYGATHDRRASCSPASRSRPGGTAAGEGLGRRARTPCSSACGRA